VVLHDAGYKGKPDERRRKDMRGGHPHEGRKRSRHEEQEAAEGPHDATAGKIGDQ
jgi:hypothetical protein